MLYKFKFCCYIWHVCLFLSMLCVIFYMVHVLSYINADMIFQVFYLTSHGGNSSDKNPEMCLYHILWKKRLTDLTEAFDVLFFPNFSILSLHTSKGSLFSLFNWSWGLPRDNVLEVVGKVAGIACAVRERFKKLKMPLSKQNIRRNLYL